MAMARRREKWSPKANRLTSTSSSRPSRERSLQAPSIQRAKRWLPAFSRLLAYQRVDPTRISPPPRLSRKRFSPPRVSVTKIPTSRPQAKDLGRRLTSSESPTRLPPKARLSLDPQAEAYL